MIYTKVGFLHQNTITWKSAYPVNVGEYDYFNGFKITYESSLLKSGVIKGEKQTRIRQSFNEGEQVKITEGPFASFTGTIKEISLEKEKLTLEVQIFGRPTPVEVNFLQVEKA